MGRQRRAIGQSRMLPMRNPGARRPTFGVMLSSSAPTREEQRRLWLALFLCAEKEGFLLSLRRNVFGCVWPGTLSGSAERIGALYVLTAREDSSHAKRTASTHAPVPDTRPTHPRSFPIAY